MTETKQLSEIEKWVRAEERIEEARAKLSGEELKKFDRSVEVAEAIKLILLTIDMAILDKNIGAAELREMASQMRGRNGTLQAWPFPETQNLAARRDLELNVFDAIAELVHSRQLWREKKDVRPYATGADVMRLFGEDDSD